jgi:hypothetical protein
MSVGFDSGGIFSHLIDEAAFVDRVDLSLWGKRRRRPEGMVSILRGFPIGGPESLYARAVEGVCPVTGNPFQLKYGVRRWPRRVPPVRLILRSQRTPLSGAQVELVSSALMCRGFRSRVSKVEMTTDLTGTSVDFLKMRLQTTARRFRTLRDAKGRKTYYVGGPRSHWQVRIYQKQPTVVRFEFIFRIPFLRKCGVRRPEELLLLRTIDLNRLVWLREIDASKLQVGIGGDLEDYQNRILRTWATCLSSSQFAQALKDSGVGRRDLLIPCAMETKLRRLQRKLVW